VSSVRRYANLVFLILLGAAILLVNVRLYVPSGKSLGQAAVAPDVLPSLRFLKAAMRDGAATSAQRFFPEGFVFQYATYGLAWVDVGLREPEGSALRREAAEEARWALRNIHSEAALVPFDLELAPPYGVFYVAWGTWLAGGILLLEGPDECDAEVAGRFQYECGSLALAFESSESPFLCSHKDKAWPCDSLVGVACLRLHDSLFEPEYEDLIGTWLDEAKARLDPATGLLPHEVDPYNGDLVQGARGSSQALIQRFLPEVDPTWSAEQYALFRRQFVAAPFSLAGVREYRRGVRGRGDVDSGPLVLGLSASASIVALGPALLHGDRGFAEPLSHSAEVLGFPVGAGHTKRYLLGAVPVVDGFLVWSKTATPWTTRPPRQEFAPAVPSWWRLPIHAVSGLLCWVLVWAHRRAGRMGRAAAAAAPTRPGLLAPPRADTSA